MLVLQPVTCLSGQCNLCMLLSALSLFAAITMSFYPNIGQQQLPALLRQVDLYEYMLSKTQTPSNWEDAAMQKHSVLVLLSAG